MKLKLLNICFSVFVLLGLGNTVNAKENKSVIDKKVKKESKNKQIKKNNSQINATSFYVENTDSGEVIAERNSDVVKPIASLTKIMTAIVVLDQKINMNDVVKIDDDDVDRYKNSRSRLKVGSEYSKDMLLHLSLMSSENRATHALARTTFSGDVKKFVEKMNEKAKFLGLEHTKFVEPTGLSEENVSTAKEYAKILKYASQYFKIKQFSTDEDVEVGSLKFSNSNKLVFNDNWNILISKTGHISEAGFCVSMIFNHNNKKNTIVVLDSNSNSRRIIDAINIKNKYISL